jgi:DNA-binding NarL/FixJ family response regulator
MAARACDHDDGRMPIPPSTAHASPRTVGAPLPRLGRDGRLTRPVRVVFADDHPFYRDGVVLAIDRHPELDLVGEAPDGVAALALIEELRPDVALLDVKMPGLDGIAVCERVLAADPRPNTRIVLLSAFLEPIVVARAVAAGAVGYLGKDVARFEICDALVHVGCGGTAFCEAAGPGVRQALDDVWWRVEPPAT